MALILHQSLLDCSVRHSEFSHETWNSGICDSEVATQWGHDPGDCHNPVARHWAELRRKGHSCGPREHELADIEDPEWGGSREFVLVETLETVPPPAAAIREFPPVHWPPDSKLPPQVLSTLIGYCVEDCREILLPPRREPPKELPPIADKKGQFLLF